MEAKEKREKQKLVKQEETMNKQREFKVGDKCIVEYTVKNIAKEERYPIHCEDVNGVERTFTRNGIVYLNGINNIMLKHIEDIIPKTEEFPKWMMVSNNRKEWFERYVIGMYEGQYIASTIVNRDAPISTNNTLYLWDYAKEIEESKEEEVEPTFNGLSNIIKLKPPIGLMPKNIWDENKKKERLSDLKRAIERYYDAGLQLNPRWVEEYNELVKEVKGE